MPQLAPPGKFQADGAVGIPLSGGKLYTYAAGTSTPKDSYTDAGLGTANTNPVILNARGEADVWLSGAYKLTLTDSADVLIWTVDNVRDLTTDATFANPTFAGTVTVTANAITWSGNPTHSGQHAFTGTVLMNGNVQIGDNSTDTLVVTPNAVTWPNSPVHSGAHTWSGVQTFSASPAGKITSGTYTPTFTLTTNITAATAVAAWSWVRVGDVFRVSGAVNITPTASGACELRCSLPIAATLSAGEMGGTGSDSGLHGSGRFSASAANNAAFLFTAASATISTFGVDFGYFD